MMSSIKCSFCDNLSLDEVYLPVKSCRNATVVMCSKCGLLQTVYQIKSYSKYPSISCDADWGNIRHGKKSRLQSNINFIKQKIDFYLINNYLDIGANRGDFVKFIQHYYPHVKITAVEHDISLIDYDSIALEIITDKFESANIDKVFDFIYCSHTLEHVDSLNLFIQNCYSCLSDDGFLFIEVPNTEVIGFDENIVEEFFIDKHTLHFIPETLSNIFYAHGFEIILKSFDNYNLSFLLKKSNYTNLEKCPNEKILFKTQDILKLYKQRLSSNRVLLRKLTDEIIMPFSKRQKMGIWGATRIFDALVKYGGLQNEMVHILVDTHISKILKEIHGIKIEDPFMLKISEPHVIFILARSSSKFLETKAHEMGFRWVVNFDELMDQVRSFSL